MINIHFISFKIILFFFLFLFLSFRIEGEEIPIIVISAGKTLQNKNSVGSDILVIEKEKIEESNSFFIGNLLDQNTNGLNFSQSGGYGTNSIVQTRGLPKRYTSIYIDGIKLSDPSTPDNSFYFNNLTLNGIERIEILKGSQSSLYGSGAIAGTINITTKKGKVGNHQNINLSTGSNNTKNLNITFDGATPNHNYFLGINTFFTNGISSMSDNDEKDGYKNKGIVSNYTYKVNNFFEIENGLRFTKSSLNYDEVTYGRTDNNKTDDEEFSYTFKLINKSNKLKNTLSYNKTDIKRKVTNYNVTQKDNYYGYRDSINFLGEYNINLDSKIVYGFDNEFDAARYKTWATVLEKKTDEAIYGQYFDLHLRPFEKIYTTFGARRDWHTTAGMYETYRITGAYKYDSDTKFRSSLGTGLRFPSLYEYFYDQNISRIENLKPEKSKSFDLGVDKNFYEDKINLSFSLFKNEYKDPISSWATNTDGGSNPGGYSIQNTNGKIKAKGIELSSNFFPNKSLNYNLNYTFTQAYDGEDCDDPSYNCNVSKYPVRIPKHSINTKFTKKYSNNINLDLSAKFISEVRDYGNVNNSFSDVILDSYFLTNFEISYNPKDANFLYAKIDNIFNKKFEQAYQYNSFGRNLSVGIKKKF